MNDDLLVVNAQDLVFIPVFLLVSLLAIFAVAKRVFPSQSHVLVRFALIRMVCVIPGFVFATQYGSMDCQAYWRWPAQGVSYFNESSLLGAAMVEYLMFPFAYWMKLSFLSCFFPFALFSALGTVFFGATLLSVNGGRFPRLGGWLICLPNIMIWCSLPGKDVMMWFFCSLLVYAVFCMRGGAKTGMAVLIALAGMFAFRPHVAITSMVAIILVLVLAPRGDNWVSRNRAGILALTFGAFLAALPLLKDYISVSDYTDIGEYTNRFDYAGQLYDTSRDGEASSIDLVGASPLTRMFAFMYRPLFLDAYNLPTLMASFENMLLFLVTCRVAFGRRLYLGLFMRDFGVSLTLYMALLGWVVLGCAGGNNLGLFSRQKVQLMPFLILLVCMVLSRNRGGRSKFAAVGI